MAKPRPKKPSKKAVAPSRKSAPAKKAQPARKAGKAAPKKAAPAKKAPKKGAPVKKTGKKAAPAKKAPPAKKPAAKKAAAAKKPAAKKTAKKAVAARKAPPAKKLAPAKKVAPAKKTAPAKKAAPVRKPAPVKKPAPVQKAAPARPSKPAATPAPVKAAAPPPKKVVPVRKAQVVADPALNAFTKALKEFHQRNWEEAAELFEKALAESDQLDLSARARQYLAACRQRLVEAAVPKRKKKDEEGDPFLRAVFERNRGNATVALDLCRKMDPDQKDERFAYLAASIHATEGRLDEAVQALSRAIELNPKNRIHAFHDSDFAELRNDRDLRQLFGLS